MELEEKVRLAFNDSFPGGDIRGFREISGGFANEAVLVEAAGGREFVLKIFGGEDTDVRRRWQENFRTEPYVLDLLESETDIPAPSAISRGEAGGVPYHFVEKMDGFSPDLTAKGARFKRLETGSKRRVMRDLGRITARYHRDTRFDGTGPLRVGETGLEVDSRDSWAGFFREMMQEWTDSLQEPFRHLRSDVLSCVKGNLGLLEGVSRHCLLHRELDPKNVMISAGEVSSVLDWEWCASGHSEFDLAVAEGHFLVTEFRHESMCNHYRKSLVRGYREFADLEDGWEDRRQLYLLLPLVWSMNFWDEGWELPARFYRKKTEKIVEELS